MGMMEHIAFQSFWQRGKTFAHSKGLKFPVFPLCLLLIHTVHAHLIDVACWRFMVECVHPSHGAPSVGFAFQVLDRGLSCSSLWHPGKSKVLWKDDHMMRYQHFATSQKHPKASKALLKGWHLRQILELLQRLPSHNFAGGFDNCRVHLRRAGRWTVDTWHILTPISKLFKLHSVQTIACQAPTCGKKREKSDCYNSDVGKTWTCMMLDQIACGTPGPLLSAPKFGSLSVNKIENLIWTNKIEQYIYLHQMGST